MALHVNQIHVIFSNKRSISSVQKSRQNILVFILFFLYFVIGVLIYKDYGISWDDPIQRFIGYENINYITGRDNNLLGIIDRYKGPTFEIFLIGIEKAIQPVTTAGIFYLRHLLIFLTFFVGTVLFYFLSKRVIKSSRIALLCTVALVLSPRIFDNSFYNSKDIPLLVIFIICFTLFFQYLDSKRTISLILLAIFCAMAVTIRIAGILPLFLVIIAIVVNIFYPFSDTKMKVSQSLFHLVILLSLFVAITVLFWPALWSNPINNFLDAIRIASHFDWKGQVLFLGKIYKSNEIPSIYPIIWILISTPLYYSYLFFIGFFSLVFGEKVSLNYLFSKERLKLFFIAAWFFGPILAVIIQRSVLYDSWRHLFFIYPAFLLIGFYGLENLVSRLNAKFGQYNLATLTAYVLLVVTFFSTAQFMIRVHPFEQLYFNRLAGSSLGEIQKRFDMDYWGLAYRRGLEYISKSDPSPAIPYFSETFPGTYTFILPEADQKRLIPVTNAQEAKYLITNYRFTKSYPPYDEVFSVQVDGAKILSVFKLNNQLSPD